MPLRVYNSLSRRKEPFTPSPGGEVKFFVCGPTVYDYLHLGHARTYLAFDIIARYLKLSGYRVRYLMNVTDVAERIVQRAEELKRDPLELARQYEAAFLEDMQSLGITSVNQYERASDYTPQMIAQVQGLIDEETIGQLSGLLYELESLGRIRIEAKDKARARGVPSPDRADALMLAIAAADPVKYPEPEIFFGHDDNAW